MHLQISNKIKNFLERGDFKNMVLKICILENLAIQDILALIQDRNSVSLLSSKRQLRMQDKIAKFRTNPKKSGRLHDIPRLDLHKLFVCN